MKLNFQQDVLNLPASILLHTDTDVTKLRVLLWLASDISLSEKSKQAQLAKLATCSVKEARDAISYWQSCGVLTGEDGVALPAMATVAEPIRAEKAVGRQLLQRADELPNYTTAELAALLESRDALRLLIDEAQRIIGKIFNLSEVNILVGMLDYLGMSEECILMLLEHCKRIGKSNLRSIEKYAYKLIDRGITDATTLEEEIRTVEAMRSFEGEIRSIFGLGKRALTSREDKMLRAWISFGYGAEIVRRAYEITVHATNEPSLPYANSILERWNADGLKTLADIERSIEEQQAKKDAATTKKSNKQSLGNSFDTDDFFRAALQRSFAETQDKT